MSLGIPSSIVAGDSVMWLSEIADRPPSDGYALTWAIRGVAGSFLNLSASVELGKFKTLITSAQSLSLSVGRHFWQAYLTDLAGNRQTIGSGRLQVLANLAGLNNFDGRSEAELLLDKVNNAISSILTGGQSYQIGDREFTRADLNELRQWQIKLRFQIYREGQALIGESPNLKIRFRDY